MARPSAELNAAWARHAEAWRHPAQALGLWQNAADVDPSLLRHRATGAWWETLARLRITLLVTREYEHLVLALNASGSRPLVSYLPMPHPSGLVVDRAAETVHVASTRNPNQVFDLAPVTDVLARADASDAAPDVPTLTPVRSRLLPGALYIHDLAMIDGVLHANAVGQNAVVRLDPDGGFERVWWPKAIDGSDGPRFEANYLQLNSIAAGHDIASSYFSASTDRVGRRRPGHRDFPVDGRGVIFSGATRDVVARGLTRPHSARLEQGVVWVDNSGYGEVGTIEDGRFAVVTKLPGWTRGLCLVGGVAFVGTSRVIPRFRQYAPGLAVDHSVCAIHAVDMTSGRVLGSLKWPTGNQIFAIDWLASDTAGSLPFRRASRRVAKSEREFFYTFCPPASVGRNKKDG